MSGVMTSYVNVNRRRYDHGKGVLVIMNKLNSVIIIIGMSLIILMLLFPPFHVMYPTGIEIDKGYAFILNPPLFWDKYESTVDMTLLSFQIGTVVILLGVVQLFFKIYRK
jgi:hypothetical protein